MSQKTTYLVAHGATVTVVRDGKRKAILAGSGFDFTDDEVKAVKAAQPGALRAPINEGVGRSQPADEDGEGEEKPKKAAKPAKGEKAKATKPAKPAKGEKAKVAEPESDEDADEDADEDEDSDI